MKVLSHPDPVVLENTLLARVDAVHPHDATARTVVVVPTARLVRHLQRRLATKRGAWLGLEVLDFDSLARRTLEHSGGARPRVASRRLLETLLRRCLTRCAENRWSRFVRKR